MIKINWFIINKFLHKSLNFYTSHTIFIHIKSPTKIAILVPLILYFYIKPIFKRVELVYRILLKNGSNVNFSLDRLTYQQFYFWRPTITLNKMVTAEISVTTNLKMKIVQLNLWFLLLIYYIIKNVIILFQSNLK